MSEEQPKIDREVIIRRRKNIVIEGLTAQMKVMASRPESKRHGIYLNAPPEALLGFRVGTHIDFEPYDALGFRHPKADGDACYYKLGGKHRESAKFASIHAGIERNKSLDTPILVWILETEDTSEIIILDGATRASIVGYIRGANPNLFRTVPLQLFEGTRDAALVEMTRRNLPGRSRDLTNEEIYMMVIHHHKNGMPMYRIADMVGLDSSTASSQISQIIELSKNGGRGVIAAYFNRRLSLKSALDIARRSEIEQEALVSAINKAGKEVTQSEADAIVGESKKNRSELSDCRSSVQRAVTTLGRSWERVRHLTGEEHSLVEKWKIVEKANKAFEEEFSAFETAYIEKHMPKATEGIDRLDELDELTDEVDDVVSYSFEEWKEKFEPIKYDLSDEWDIFPEVIRPYATDAIYIQQNAGVPSNGRIWSIMERESGFYLASGVLKNAIALVTCEESFEDNGTKREVNLFEESDVIETITFDTDEGTSKLNRKKWRPPASTSGIAKDVIIKVLYEGERPNRLPQILEVIDDNEVSKSALDRLIGSDSPRERLRRLGILLEHWTSNDNHFNGYLVRRLENDDEGARYSIRRVGKKS